MLILLCVLFLILCLFYFNNYLYNNERARYINTLPGPKHLPIIGNIHQISTDPVKLFELIHIWVNKYFPVFKMWLGPTPLIGIIHPDDLEIVLANPKHINKEFGYQHMKPWLQEGLLLSNGSLWHQRRKIITKAFHFKILQKYFHVIIKRGEQFKKDNSKEEKETIKDVFAFYGEFTLDVICESAMGISVDHSQKQTAAKFYKQAVSKIMNITIFRIIKPYITDWMMLFFPKINKEYKEALKVNNSFIDKIVKERREYHESTNYASLDELHDDETLEDDAVLDAYDQEKKLSMLDLLLKCEKNGLIDDKGIKDEVCTFVVEGYDTSANVLSFSTVLLAENKDSQDKARAEIEEILNANNGKLTMSDLQKMTYLERCIKESLRLYPIAPYITRYIMEDVQLKNCKIPKGTNVFINIFAMQRHSEFWPEPEKFDPDRFLIENSRKRHTYSYLPFSAGPRNCIGQKLGMMELKIVLTNILYNYYLEPVTFTKNVKLKTAILLAPSAPIYTKFIKIDRNH